MKQISQISRILKFSISVFLLLLGNQVSAESINLVYVLDYKENNADLFFSVDVNSPRSQGLIESQLSSQENELGIKGNYVNFSTNNNRVVKLPLPATVLLFGGALTWWFGFSRRTHKQDETQVYEYVDVLGIKFLSLNYERAISLFQQWIISKKSHQVCFANVHTIVSSLNDKKLRGINSNSLNAMDGVPVVWYARLVHGKRKASKVCGPDLMLKCLDEGRKRDWKHFLLGGSEDVLCDLVNAMQNMYPGVEIVGWHSPAFRPLTDEEDAELVSMINEAKPDFLWVGLGAPKQELWISEHLARIHVPVQLGVGAAFNFHSGHIKRAPIWMQKYGLEWLYRVIKETRLLKRYLITNPIFLMLFIKDIVLIRLLRLK